MGPLFLQKLLTNLIPTDDERTMLTEAKAAKPDIPLAPAEDFLYTLASIPELKARLSLWRFNYVFKQIEEVREVVEDLSQFCMHFI